MWCWLAFGKTESWRKVLGSDPVTFVVPDCWRKGEIKYYELVYIYKEELLKVGSWSEAVWTIDMLSMCFTQSKMLTLLLLKSHLRRYLLKRKWSGSVNVCSLMVFRNLASWAVGCKSPGTDLPPQNRWTRCYLSADLFMPFITYWFDYFMKDSWFELLRCLQVLRSKLCRS